MIIRKGDKTEYLDYEEENALVVEYAGECPVVLEKLYGPLVVDDVRITLDKDAGEWVVECKRSVGDEEESHYEWQQIIRFSCQ
jgi:hypothetical protein